MKNKIIGICLIILLALLLGKAVIFISRIKERQPVQPIFVTSTLLASSKAKMVSPKSSVSSVSFVTSTGWNIYRNTEFKYAIQYPSDWKVAENEESDIREGGSFNVNVGFEPMSTPSNCGPRTQENCNYLLINVQDNSSHVKLGDIANGKTVYIDGVYGLRDGPSPVPLESEFAFQFYKDSLRSSLNVINGNSIYTLIGESYGPNFKTSQKLVDKIISTFKFLK